MIRRYVILFTLIICTTFCGAQDMMGCFKANVQNGLELESDIDFSKYDVFFVGEFHGVYGVPEIKLALIKYLNKNLGITDVFMEIGYSAAYLYNSYLETGDTSFITHPAIIYTFKKPDMDFWKGLYAYNQKLEYKITIRGMDFERMEFVKVLRLLRPAGSEKPKEIRSTLEYIDTIRLPAIGPLNSDEQKTQDSIYEHLREVVKTNRDLFEQYYGADFKIVEQIMFNESTYADFHQRNSAMYNNIVKQVEDEQIKKFIIISGLAHANKEHEGSVCGLLLQNKLFKHKLADIGMVCKNCYDWQQPQNGQVVYKAPYTYCKDSLLMGDIYEKNAAAGCKYTMIPADAVIDNRVYKYSDYIILLKDQPEY